MIKVSDFRASGRQGVMVLAVVLAAGAGDVAVHAQPSSHSRQQHFSQSRKRPSGPPNALQGFSQNRDKPVKINADELEVHDKDKMAVFSGDVHLVQGDVSLRSATLIVYYDDQASGRPKSGKGAAASTQISPQQNQQIKRVEAKGNVLVVQKDQRATGDKGIFDMRANTVTMHGNVVISQGDNVLRGDNLTVNMTTGDALLTCGKGHEGCRVQGLFNPAAMKQSPGAFPFGRKPKDQNHADAGRRP